jgi:hypothetical protein
VNAYRNLVDYADQRFQGVDLYLDQVQVGFVVRLDGSALTILPVAKNLQLPRTSVRSNGAAAHVAYDNLTYTFGLTGKAAPKKAKKDPAKVAENLKKKCAKQHAAYLAAVQDLAKKVQHPAVQRLAKLYRDPGALQALVKQASGLDCSEATSLTVVTFEIDDVEVHQIPEVQRYMRDKYLQGLQVGICSLTGKHGALARTFERVKGAPGAASGKGISLTGTNSACWQHRGREQGGNAHLGVETWLKIKLALEKLLEKHEVAGTDKKGKPTTYRRYQHAIVIDETTVFLHYTVQQGDAIVLDLLQNPLDDAVQQYLRAPFNGRVLPEQLPVKFRQTLLTPEAAQATVHSLVLRSPSDRGQLLAEDDASVLDVINNILQYYRDTGLTLSLPRLLAEVKRVPGQKKPLTLPLSVTNGLLRTVLFGDPLPLPLVYLALARLRSALAKGKNISYYPHDIFLALLRLWSQRSNPQQPVEGDMSLKNWNEVLAQANEEFTLAFKLGMWLVCAGKIQNAAHNQRLKQDLSYTLSGLVMVNFNKLRGIKPGYAVNLQKLLQTLTPTTPLPRSFALSDKAMFYQGMAYMGKVLNRYYSKERGSDT